MNSWRTTINCSRFAIGVSYCHLCTISLGKNYLWIFYSNSFVLEQFVCVWIWSPHKFTHQKPKFRHSISNVFFLLNVFTSRHFVPLSLNGVQRGVFMFRIIHPFDLSSWCFFPLSSQFCWNVRSWFQKDLIFAGIRYSKRL